MAGTTSGVNLLKFTNALLSNNNKQRHNPTGSASFEMVERIADNMCINKMHNIDVYARNVREECYFGYKRILLVHIFVAQSFEIVVGLGHFNLSTD